ncbi:DoxX family protein [Tunturiibacter psychrotolerans]|uniref:DoxX family protein n=1 Tax=Tunturiibacter psychrotolerans TaxID=3069686 RepID=UPI003D1FF039
MSAADQQSKALAFLRISIGLIFLIFAEYKLTSTRFIRTGMAQYINQFLNEGSYPFIRPFLRNVILPHTVFFGTIVSISELLIALSLITGVLVRCASLGGLTMMLVLLFSSNYPGPQAPFWEFFGASLEHSVLSLCFIALLIAPSTHRWALLRSKQ